MCFPFCLIALQSFIFLGLSFSFVIATEDHKGEYVAQILIAVLHIYKLVLY